MSIDLLSPEFLAKIEQLRLISRKVLAGRMKGERRSKRKGFSTEFADHRGYVVGDDLRFVDWNILARLDRLFIKLFEEEEDLRFHIILDNSASMGFGEPTKFSQAQRLAAALGYIALVQLDRVRISTASDELVTPMPALRGRASALRLLDGIANLPLAAGTQLAEACRSFSIKHSGKGVVILISDLLDKSGYEAGLKYLAARNFDLFVIQILAQEEIDPPVAGDLKLVDAEDGDAAEVTVSAPLLARYKKTLAGFLAGAEEFCHRRGITYLFASNQVPFENVILQHLRAKGLIR